MEEWGRNKNNRVKGGETNKNVWEKGCLEMAWVGERRLGGLKREGGRHLRVWGVWKLNQKKKIGKKGCAKKGNNVINPTKERKGGSYENDLRMWNRGPKKLGKDMKKSRGGGTGHLARKDTVKGGKGGRQGERKKEGDSGRTKRKHMQVKEGGAVHGAH